MNSRERVLAAINHGQPDRVPVDLGGTRQSGIAASTCQQLKSRLGISGGSLDCQKTLPFGTPDEVAQEVREHVRVFALGGGYVFAPVHNIQANVPPENVIAMFDAVCS